MLTLNDGRKELYQWDTGRTATVDIDCDIVHFSNLKYGESLAAEVKSDKVSIPNKLLMSGEPIYCWAFVKDDNGAYTKKEQTISVTKRAKPSDYVYTETEVITIKTAVEKALEEAKESGEFKGDKGDKGDQGTPGQRGEKGEKGDQGIPGEKGAKGDKGDKGETGAQGIQGVKGDPGEQGIQGIPGAKGDKGDPGEPGAKGDKGDPGDTPYIGENGNWFIGDTDTGIPASGTGGTPNAVQYVPQALTGEQQTQARKNIDAQSQVYAVKRANPWSAEDCVNASVRGLKLYGACAQVSSPSPDNPQEITCNHLTYTLKNDAEYHGGSVTAPSLYGIGDAQDEWDAMTGNGVRKITKIILDGTINYLTKTDNTAGSYLYHFIYNNQGVADVVQNTLCTHFEHVKIAYPNQEGQYTITTKTIFINAKGLVWGDNAVLQNADEINAFLASQSAAGTPVTVYYEMAEAEPFTTAPLENPLTTPDGYAQFLSSGNGAAGDIEAEYAVDVEKRYVPKETYSALEERVAALESAAIGG